METTQSEVDALLSTADGLTAEAENQASQGPPEPVPSASAPAWSLPRGAPARAEASQTRRRELDRILKLSLPLAVKLAEQQMPVERVLEINVGVIIEFDRSFDAELDLMIGDCRIGTGQAVKVGENFGLRITRIGNLDEKIKALGGADSGT